MSTPRYDRAALVPRILHLGVGGFHRAHLALYLHELATRGGGWGICGLGRLEADRRMASVLASQDCLYALIERDSQGSRPRIVGSIVDYALAVADEEAFARRIADPEVAILSMTITEGGYSLEQPNPTIEAIASGLDARRIGGGVPLTILSCDNLPGNGRVARRALTTVCEARSSELARFVETSCTFPNSMVDRITPQTTDGDRAWLRDEVGIDDGWPVVAEPFRQWVIEDQFANGRPRFEDVGVLFTDDVRDWELYKLRMLNATHSCMAYLMALQGVVYVDEAMAIPAVRRYLERFLSEEAIPTLAEIPGHSAAAYGRTDAGRYENTGVRDQIARLCIDGTAKFPTFLIPTVERQLELGARSSAPCSRWQGGRVTSRRFRLPSVRRTARRTIGGASRQLAARPRGVPQARRRVHATFARERTVPRRFLRRGRQPRRVRTARRDRTACRRVTLTGWLPPTRCRPKPQLAPVTYDASSERRKATTRATSSVEP